MKVPFVNYGLQYKRIKKEIDQAITRCLEKGDLILRDEVKKFEERFAKLCKAKYCLSLNSGTDAIYLALEVLKPKKVITTWHVFEGVIEQIKKIDAEPVLIDVNRYFLIVEEEIEEEIKSLSGGDVIIPVHLNGAICDMENIKKIARKKGCFIIEDSCQAIGKPLEGDIACFSFYPAKILGCYGDGGAVITNSYSLYKRMKDLRDKGYINSRLDNIQAAVLNVKLKYLPFYLKRRKEIAEMYLKGLEKLAEKAPLILPWSKYWQNFVLFLFTKEIRDGLKDFLQEKGIETMIKGHKYDKEWLRDGVLSLPLYPELTNKQVNYVIEAVKEFFSK